MKNFKLIKLLVLIGVLIMSVSQMWAASVTSDGTKRLYFNANALNWWRNDNAKLFAYFYNCDASLGCGTSSWSEQAVCSFGDVYYVLIPSGTWKGVILTRHGFSTENPDWSNKLNQSGDITLDASKTYISSFSENSSTVTWEADPPMPTIKGDFDEWGSGYRMVDGWVTLTLDAEDAFEFKIVDQGGTWWGKSSATITNTTDPWLQLSSGGSNDNISFTANEAGEYIFKWSSDGYVGVYYPQARLAKNKVIYFDARNSDASHWNVADFASRFYFKYYDSGSDQSDVMVVAKDTAQHSVYPVTVPNNDFIGRVQINRYSADGKTDWTNATGICYASGRESIKQNCMSIKESEANWWTDQTLEWGTYCPPKKTSTISDNGTVTYGGNGGSSTPFLVEKGGTIKVSASSTNIVEDANMETRYNFYDGSTSKQNGTGTTLDYTASSTANTTHQMKVNAYNYYNSTSSSDKVSSILYYKTVVCYTISYAGNGNTGGDAPATTKHMTGTSPTVASKPSGFVRSNYSFANWNTASDGGGTTYVAGSGTIASISANVPLYAIWTQSVTLDMNGGDDSNSSVTLTYNSTRHDAISTPSKTGYTFTGWYTGSGNRGSLVIATDGTMQANVDGYTEAGGKWTRNSTTNVLYAHWTANQYAITLDDRGATTASSTNTTLKATYDSNTLTATITNPAKTGYTFAGWYVEYEAGSGIGKKQVINTSGELVANVADHTDASANWIKAGTATLYARWKANANASAFNFQYATSGSTYYSSDWTVENFGDATDNMRTVDNFTMPDPSSKKFYVGWGGDFISSGLGSSSWSAEANLSDLPLHPSGKAIGTATGATGKLVMWDNSGESNVGVRFEPDGYGLTYASGTIAFHSTPRENLYETNVVTLTSSDVSGNFTVKLKTGDGYTTCARSATESASTVGDRTSKTLANGMQGRFQIWINNDGTNNNFYLMFVECEDYFLTSDGDWSDDEKWSLGRRPTIEEDVYLRKAITVDVADAKAKSVLIDQYDSNTGKLTVASTGALVVATTIQKKDGDGNTVATEETDIILESDASGTGALVAGSASTTTKATMQFYSKAKYADSKYINQYFGIPADSVSKLNYYGSYLQKYDQPTDSWISFTEESKMGPWTAYRILREETSEGTYEVSGTLLLPGTGDGKTKTLTLNTSSHANDNMFANSWAAPIDITKLDTENDFVGATATIYIFNAGSAADYSTNGGSTTHKGARAGQWIELPVSATMAVPGDFDLNVIPSQQAFLVQATSGSGEHSLKLDYEKLVYNPIKANGATITPTRAPRHEQANDLEIVRMFLVGESGLGDRVLMYVRDDFSADEMDNGWEAYKLPGSEFAPQLCAYSGLGEMSISATNVIEGTVLGFYAGTEDSEYTFTFGYEGDNVWYLNDLEAQQSTLINAASSYNFSAVPGTVAERRFVISHTPIANTPTGIDNSEAVEGTQARKQMINGILYIIRGGQIYSTDGQIVK